MTSKLLAQTDNPQKSQQDIDRENDLHRDRNVLANHIAWCVANGIAPDPRNVQQWRVLTEAVAE